MIATLILCGIAHSALSELSAHEELHAISDGDAALIEGLEHLPEGSIVYAENEHWGHIYSIQSTLASHSPDTWDFETRILHSKRCYNGYCNRQYGDCKPWITHAIASPKGVMMQYIQASTHWEKCGLAVHRHFTS